MKVELPQRRQNRITCYDYSQNGAYFISICTKDRKPLLSDIVGDEARIVLKPYGEIAEQWTRMISEKFPQVTVDKYVIMPDHIHMVFRIDPVGEAFRLPCTGHAMQKNGTGNPSPAMNIGMFLNNRHPVAAWLPRGILFGLFVLRSP